MGESEKPKQPSSQTNPGRAAEAVLPAGAGAAAAVPEGPPPEEKTQPYRLAVVAEKLATQRRRTTAAELVVKRARQQEVRVPLDKTETVIGRDPRCDIVLSEGTASRRHARVARNDAGFFEIVDLGSQNGVLVEDERVERMTLLDGDAFVIGETAFSIFVGEIVGGARAQPPLR